MRVYFFTEQSYPDAWDEPFLRVDISNDRCDPRRTSELYNVYLDEYMAADELGMSVMINEHHSTASCISASANVMLSILSRQTKRARILALGVPLANRGDPLRIAEELSMVDTISGGRLEMGFVKGVPYEVPISPLNPVRMMDRFWESHDLILKAMSHRGGPFSWEGRHFQYRTVNIWPQPLQQPHPPVWISALSESSVPDIARRGYVLGTVLMGYGNTRRLFDRYRKTCADLGLPPPGRDRFGYLPMAAVGHSEAEARRRAEVILSYLSGKNAKVQYSVPPGYFSVEAMAAMMHAPAYDFQVETGFGRSIPLKGASIDDLIEAGVLICGTPDQVYKQIVDFDEGVGGLGNLMLMLQAGVLDYKDTIASMTLFAKEVMPRLHDRFGDGTVVTAPPAAALVAEC